MLTWDFLFGVLKMVVNRKIIQTSSAPEAIGMYSQGISTDQFVFTSGQIPLIPGEGKLLDGSFSDQVKQVLENVDAVLTAGGSSLQNAVKLTVFLTDLSNFPEVNAVFSQFFKSDPPARSAVEVSALPMKAEVEIEAVGVIP